MTTVNVTQLIGDDELELAVTLDGDGGIARADLAAGGELPPALAELIDWNELSQAALAAYRARDHGWP